MKELFSPRRRFSTWRKLWVWLAEAEKELGLAGISDQAIAEMQAHVTIGDDEFGPIAEEEKRRRHDVRYQYNWNFSSEIGVGDGACPWLRLGRSQCCRHHSSRSDILARTVAL